MTDQTKDAKTAPKKKQPTKKRDYAQEALKRFNKQAGHKD